MLSLRWKQEPGKHSLLYGLQRSGTRQKRPIHKDPLSPTIQQLIDSIESRTNRSSPSTLWKLKSRTFLTEDKPSTASFSRLTLAAAIAFWDLFVASNAQLRSFTCNQTQFEYRYKCYSYQSFINAHSYVINILCVSVKYKQYNPIWTVNSPTKEWIQFNFNMEWWNMTLIHLTVIKLLVIINVHDIHFLHWRMKTQQDESILMVITTQLKNGQYYLNSAEFVIVVIINTRVKQTPY